jgi:hypothetical protein
VLGARCSVLGARCSVLGARCSVLALALFAFLASSAGAKAQPNGTATIGAPIKNAAGTYDVACSGDFTGVPGVLQVRLTLRRKNTIQGTTITPDGFKIVENNPNAQQQQGITRNVANLANGSYLGTINIGVYNTNVYTYEMRIILQNGLGAPIKTIVVNGSEWIPVPAP